MPRTALRGCSVARRLGSLLENEENRPQCRILPLVGKLNDAGSKYSNQLAVNTIKLNISKAFFVLQYWLEHLCNEMDSNKL